MKALVIIPARGGSKGIPHKNIKPLAGIPLIGYAINTAREVVDDCDICVSTDDPEIAATAEQLGVKVPFLRPAELATDKSGSREVMLHAVNFFKDNGIDYDTIILLQPTSPFRTSEDVKGCLNLYKDGVDMVVSVKEASCNPYYNCFETNADGFLKISKGNGQYTRRQDVPKAWEYNGAVYIINVKSLQDMPMSSFPHRLMYEMPASRSIDLDTPTDWMVAEALMNSK